MAASERADPLTNEAPDAPRLTRFDWDKIAAEEAAKLEIEEREEAEAEALKRTKGADASSRDAPRSAAEAEERRKREALREAKNAWLERDAADLAAKLVVGEGERGAKPRTITSADLGESKNAVHVKGATDCVFVIDSSVRCAKLFVEDCVRCEVRVAAVVVTQHAEIWGCVDCTVDVQTQLATIQADGCVGLRVRYAEFAHFGAIVHATCDGSLIVQFQRIVTQVDLVAAQAEADAAHAALTTTKDASTKDPIESPIETNEVAQYITRRVDGKLLTERVVRGKDEFPTTAREMIEARREAAVAGCPDAAKAIEESGGDELGGRIDADTSAERAERRKDAGNEAFKEGNYPQAAVHYTQCLELKPRHHVALANRAACFLKMGEHAKALDDASSCASIAPDYVKGHFRKGLALHAMGAHGEAVVALTHAEKLDPKNAQVVEALRMAAFKARQQPRDD